ncbi:MAG: hypothetical protein J5740_06075 [Bacteroidales bacterium]|nr:hypothetical protein [Bacteroidales bacterium]
MEKEDPIARIEREKAEKKKSNGFAVVALAIIAVGLAAALAIVGTRDYKMVKELEADKADLSERIETLQKEFADLSSDYEFINSQLDSSREEVAVLVSRIKSTEATNRAKMRQYEKELGTLRSIMRNYLVQIDSLNQQNIKLSQELSTTRQSLAAATGKNEELEAQNKEYAAKVATGAKIKARGIVCKAYNGSDKVTDRSSRTRRLAVELSLVENDLAERGPITIYLRVKDPDGNLLLDGTGASFTLAGEAVAATASREVDYEGDEVDMIIYVNDIPQYVKGVYVADVYSAAGLLGSTELMLR